MARVIGLIFEREPAKIACPHCGKEYASEKALASHIAKAHAEDQRRGGDA